MTDQTPDPTNTPDGAYRCPECDTYSGHFTSSPNPDGSIEMVHSICGRAGSVASFTRGTPEYDRACGDDDYNGYGDEDEDEDDGETAATALNLAGLPSQTWVDLAPHLSCREAEVVKAFLLAWKDDWTAQVFIEAHSLGDDDESDLHFQGGDES